MERLMKHAYLYATFSDLPDQLGAIIVRDDVIIGGGWNQRIEDTIVSEILHALITCQHSTQDSMLVCPMQPSEGEASLIILAGIATVVYAERLKSNFLGLKILEKNDIEIIKFEGYLGCFKLNYQGKTFEP